MRRIESFGYSSIEKSSVNCVCLEELSSESRRKKEKDYLVLWRAVRSSDRPATRNRWALWPTAQQISKLTQQDVHSSKAWKTVVT